MSRWETVELHPTKPETLNPNPKMSRWETVKETVFSEGERVQQFFFLLKKHCLFHRNKKLLHAHTWQALRTKSLVCDLFIHSNLWIYIMNKYSTNETLCSAAPCLLNNPFFFISHRREGGRQKRQGAAHKYSTNETLCSAAPSLRRS